jgi:hypothetical protein
MMFMVTKIKDVEAWETMNKAYQKDNGYHKGMETFGDKEPRSYPCVVVHTSDTGPDLGSYEHYVILYSTDVVEDRYEDGRDWRHG